MLARVAAKQWLCLACRQSLRQRLGADPPRPLRLYSSESSGGIRSALEALRIEKGEALKRGINVGAESESPPAGDQIGIPAKDVETSNRPSPQQAEVDGAAQSEGDLPVLPVLETEGNDEPTPSRPAVFKHDLLRQSKLSVDALGQSVEALIIKNPNKMKRKRRALRTLAEEKKGKSPEWIDLVPEKDTESDFSDVVWRNLHELRPSKLILRLEEFTQLMDTLVDGFKKDQLLHFYNVESNEVSNLEPAEEYPWLVRQGEWVAQNPHEWGRLSPKQAVALAIMQTRWDLKIKEHLEGPGRIQLWLRPSVFHLVTHLHKTILEDLGSQVLQRASGEKITANTERSRLSVFTRGIAVPAFLGRLAENLKGLRTRRVAIGRASPDRLDRAALKELGRLTKTHIEHDADAKELEVTWIDTAKSDGDGLGGEREDTADVVLRLLLAVEPRRNLSHSTQVLARSASFTKYEREKRSMSWRDKLGSWSRYVYTGSSKQRFPNGIDLPEPTTFDPEEAGTENRLTATFGHILHATEDAAQVASADAYRILSPVVPHPAALTSILDETDEQVTRSIAMILNFSPVLSQDAPEVKLRVPLNNDTDFANFTMPSDSTLYGVVPWSTHDVMMPLEAVDARISQQRVLALDKDQDHLQSFLANSKFNFLEGDLRTPSRVRLAIPAAWRGGQSDGVDVSYMFMGIEVHHSVDVAWQGHTLRYQSIQAGRHGGQRQEISIQAATDENGVISKGQTSSFLELVSDVASGGKFSWADGYKLAKERTLDDIDIELVDEDAEIEEGEDVFEGAADMQDKGEVAAELGESATEARTETATEPKEETATEPRTETTEAETASEPNTPTAKTDDATQPADDAKTGKDGEVDNSQSDDAARDADNHRQR